MIGFTRFLRLSARRYQSRRSTAACGTDRLRYAVAVLVLPKDHAERLARARLSLEGLSLGDAFGERFFVHPGMVDGLIEQRALPSAAVWSWTDDTAMAVSIVAELEAHGEIDRDSLAARFAASYRRDPERGYGPMAGRILSDIAAGFMWDVAAAAPFQGQGSMGNGSAMRSAPIGAYFADDPAFAAGMAALSADPTHAHPDGRAGAIAVAVAAALASSTALSGDAFLTRVLALTPEGPTHAGLARAVSSADVVDARAAAKLLGSGQQVLCSDTVPFSLWCASRHLDDYEEALWSTVSGLGDRDTTCAIVGGIVALRVGSRGLPERWMKHREPLAHG
jgi:ADP-ribosylglycohydrolase